MLLVSDMFFRTRSSVSSSETFPLRSYWAYRMVVCSKLHNSPKKQLFRSSLYFSSYKFALPNSITKILLDFMPEDKKIFHIWCAIVSSLDDPNPAAIFRVNFLMVTTECFWKLWFIDLVILNFWGSMYLWVSILELFGLWMLWHGSYLSSQKFRFI